MIAAIALISGTDFAAHKTSILFRIAGYGLTIVRKFDKRGIIRSDIVGINGGFYLTHHP